MKSKLFLIFLLFSSNLSLKSQVIDTVNHINNECNNKSWINSINVDFNNDSLSIYGSVVMNCMLDNGLIREVKEDSIFLIAYDTCGANCWCEFDYQTFIPDQGYDQYYISLGYQGFPECDYTFYMDTIIYRGVQQISNINNLNIIVAPNPIESYLMISSNLTIDELYVYSILGERVFYEKFEQKSKSLRTDLSSIQRGVYIIHLKSGNQDKYQKIIKK